MFILFAILTIILLYSFYFLLKKKEEVVLEQLREKQLLYDKLFAEQSRLHKDVYELETQAEETFALYEITKDITKTMKEEEAFGIFKDRLQIHNMKFQDIQLLGVKADVSELTGYFVFPLKSLQKEIGYLAIQGISDVQKEMFSVLAHQFSLGLNRIRLYEEIEKLAITDSLTKLYTRRHCLARFSEELQRSEKYKMDLSFLMLDVDNFKFYNDKFGHLVGDVILRDVAKSIKSNVREIDLVGRFGGEEFLVILTDTPKQGAEFVAERIRETIQNKEIKAYDERLKVTVSIGVTTFPEDAKTPEELLDKADWCLYRAKKMGKNRVCVFGEYKS